MIRFGTYKQDGSTHRVHMGDAWRNFGMVFGTVAYYGL
jgi:hypothetical protein